MNGTPHEIIRASAGTGKTYQLTLRYLRLLCATRAPERIIALTFTRKAAGEFFEKIFHRLADAAESEAAAAALSAELGLALRPADFRALLRLLLERLHRLQLGTYDSFFARIVRAFPLELGLSGPPRLLDDAAAEEAVRQAQNALARRRESDPLLTEFWHAFKRATMGREEKRLTALLDLFIAEAHELFLEAPDPAQWGDPHRLWPAGCPWEAGDFQPRAAADALRAHFARADFSPAQQRQWEQILAALADWQPPLPPPKRVTDLTAKLLAVYDALPTGEAVITVQRRQTIDAIAGAWLQRLARFCVAAVLLPRLEATRGRHEVISRFEDIYREEIRRPGHVTIADLTRLLGGAGAGPEGLADPLLRATIDYRLDGAYDHWLLDEFQDTSHGQWRVLRDLVDEVLQDPEGRRSFFAVGDPKQCLYLWRNSDDRLFGRLEARYGATLSVRTLARSFRSAPAVLAAANGVFGQTAAWPEWLPAGLARRWQHLWVRHESAPRLAHTSGHAALLHAPAEDDTGYATLAALLQAIRPLERGLTAAVLVRTNEAARTVVDYLRAHDGPPCALASEHRPGTDNAAAAGLRALLTLAAHPGDTAAWGYLALTPPGASLCGAAGHAAALSRTLLARLAEGGFTALVEDWRAGCETHFAPDDAFSRERLRRCRDLALAVDATGECDPDRFLRQLDALSLREAETPGALSVLTVHKAKGLDWDVVFLLDLDGKKITQRRQDLAVQRDASGEVEWILDLPPAELLSADPVLSAHLAQAEEDAGFETLCVLYVALTRARRGLYIVSHDTEGSKAVSLPRLLNEVLGGPPAPLTLGSTRFTHAWAEGEPEWFLAAPAVAPAPTTAPSAPAPAATRGGVSTTPPAARPPRTAVSTGTAAAEPAWLPLPRLRALQPSGSPSLAARPLGSLFAADAPDGETFGRALHALCARIEWWPVDPLAEADLWAELADSTPPPLLATLRRIIATPATRACFLPPTADATASFPAPAHLLVWREKAFEVARQGCWISGRFDRVVLHQDAAGRTFRADLIDFKTDRLDTTDALATAAARHHEQIQWYRDALGQLLGLPPTAINASLLFTSLPAVHHVAS